MNLHLVLFEDRHWRDLRPLTDVLPVPALAFGASSLGARLLDATRLPLLATEARREPLAAWQDAPAVAGKGGADDDEVLALNAAALSGEWLAEAIKTAGPALLVAGDRTVGARLPWSTAASGLGKGEEFEAYLLGLELPARPCSSRVIRWPWQLMEWNAEAITADLANAKRENSGEVHGSAVLLEPSRISIADGAKVDALAVLDARGGPIRLGPRVLVHAHTLVEGPCAVGEGTQLFGGTIARSTIGPECRIAGEVEESVWQGYANKRHHGFVGNSVIGEWANLGAMTTTSNLKNNYGLVRVWVDGREVDTGSARVGAMIGAHAKTGIGSLLPTGASIGAGANLFGGGRFAPKRVPAFGWWDGERMEEHKLDRFMETARIAMSRRGRTLGAAEERLLASLFEGTAKERPGA